jgi:hypothetical protein
MVSWAGLLRWRELSLSLIYTASNTTITCSNISDALLLRVGMRVISSNFTAGFAIIQSINSIAGTFVVSNVSTASNTQTSDVRFEYQFEFPPNEDSDDQIQSESTVQRSLSGIEQVQTFHLRINRQIQYNFITKNDRDFLMSDFFKNWSLQGKEFRYRETDTENFKTYQLQSYQFTNSRTVKKHPSFLYSLNLNIKRSEAISS